PYRGSEGTRRAARAPIARAIAQQDPKEILIARRGTERRLIGKRTGLALVRRELREGGDLVGGERRRRDEQPVRVAALRRRKASAGSHQELQDQRGVQRAHRSVAADVASQLLLRIEGTGADEGLQDEGGIQGTDAVVELPRFVRRQLLASAV